MTRKELDKILKSDDKDLSHTDLLGVDLTNVNLTGTNLTNANLSNADLRWANLKWADLRWADLSNADLSDANLTGTNLTNANLSNADLKWANLKWANLRWANLRNVNLSNANLINADLSHTDLLGADLTNVNLSHVDLRWANLSLEDKCRLGEILEKKIIGYKKLNNNIIATLEIPAGAIIFGINKKQFRTNKAKCIALSNKKIIGYSIHNIRFSYEIGKKYTIKDFDLNYAAECSTGIHFFKTLKEAKEY